MQMYRPSTSEHNTDQKVDNEMPECKQPSQNY